MSSGQQKRGNAREAEERDVVNRGPDLGDAWDEPDTGQPPCIFCRREIPCECDGEPCMCSCGRCMADLR